MARQKTRDPSDDEPVPEGEGWVEWGGQLLWVAGWTSGGAPYGLTAEEWRWAMQRAEHGAGWARARWVLEELFALHCGPATAVEVGRVSRLGQGLGRDVFWARVDLDPDPEALAGDYAVLLGRRGSDAEHDEGVRRELALLSFLGRVPVPFRIPRGIGALPESGKLAMVRSVLAGVPLDLRAGRQRRVRPWEVVGGIAAAVHGLDVSEPDRAKFRQYATRREHAVDALAVFDELSEPEAMDARAWAWEHLPPPEPAKLIHGDLLGQNILLEPGEPPAVIDWEYAEFGDPAYDLAVVTRGIRRPFHIDRGFDRLMDAYHEAGGADVLPEHVRLHELTMAAAWYRNARDRKSGGERPAEALARIRRVLELATR